ncbi:MAG: hypothetical protein KZQ93_06955 [Candidatus Thiodiazotropha sp. (ex Monitilora ramsayi)]|nr:hypothetical protein [Candidatus Thiodiazotropha sp. (ex Monitilora ramsayi)]
MKYIPNPHIEEFRGYLDCLSRLCANGYSFGVSSYEADTEIDSLVSELTKLWGSGDEYMEPSSYEYVGRELVEYEVVFDEIKGYIFNGLLSLERMDSDNARNYAKKSLTEDINEYYGLVSISLNENGVFHPLISSEVYRLNIKCQRHERSFFFIVKIENLYVLTSFVKEVSEQE